MAPSKKDLQNALEEKEAQLKQLETDKKALESKKREEGAQAQLKIDEANERNKKLEDSLKKSQAELNSEKSRADQLSKEKDGLQEDLDETRKAREEQEKQQQKATKEIKALSDELFAFKAKNQEENLDFGPTKDKLGETEGALAQEVATRNKLESQLREAQEKIEALEKEKVLEDKRRKEEGNAQSAAVKVAQDKLADSEKAKASVGAEYAAEKKRLEDEVEDAKISNEQISVELNDAKTNAHKTELQALANAGGKAMSDRGHSEHVGFSEKLAQGLAQKVLDLEDQLYNKSAEAVAQGERLLACAEQLKDTKAKLKTARSDVDNGRELLLTKIAGGNCDASLYAHVALKELARQALKAAAGSSGGSKRGGRKGNASVSKSSMSVNSSVSKDEEDDYGDDFEADGDADADGDGDASVSAAGGGGGGGVEAIGRLQREGNVVKAENEKLKAKLAALKQDLAASMTAVNEVRILKDKTADLAGRTRQQKEARARSDTATKHANEKVVALSEHIEKLMVHLKHEAAAKAKLVDLQRRTEKEAALLRSRNGALVKKNAGRERVIAELKEGARILEEQLRLMDEKYVELRAKLDWTRASSQKEVRKVQQEANSLRAQWALAVDSGAMPGGDSMSMSYGGGESSMGGMGKKKKKKMGKGKGQGLGPSPSAPQLTPLPNAPQTHSLRQTSQPLQGMPSNNYGSGESEADAPWSTQKISGLHSQVQGR